MTKGLSGMSDLPAIRLDNDLATPLALDVTRLQALVDLHQDSLDALPMSIVVYEAVGSTSFRMVAVNLLALQLSGFSRNDLLGKLTTDIAPPEEAAQSIKRFQACISTGTSLEIEEMYTLPTGTMWSQSLYLPLPARHEQSPRVLVLGSDISARKQREQEERQHQESIIAAQAATLTELSTPLLTISATTVVMPLVGTMDARRVQHMMEVLLSGVAATRATNVILDITGVQIVDTQVASAFVRASQAVSLLGAQVILTGIRPEVAQTLIGLGIDLAGIVTRSTLQSGIAYAMDTNRHIALP